MYEKPRVNVKVEPRSISDGMATDLKFKTVLMNFFFLKLGMSFRLTLSPLKFGVICLAATADDKACTISTSCRTNHLSTAVVS